MDARDIGERSDVVLRMAMPGHGGTANQVTSLPAAAVRAPRMRVVVPGVVLAQQVLAVVVAVRRAHHGVDVVAGGR